MAIPVLEKQEHFDLYEIAAGIYAAVAGESGAAIGNAGIVDLGNLTLIFDTFETPQAGFDLRQTAERLTGRAATIVINSHAHADHWFGNQAFLPEATLVATHATRAAMIPLLEEAHESREHPDEWQAWLKEEQDRLLHEENTARRVSITLNIRRIQAAMAALPILDLKLPDLTFDGKLRFLGTGRSAELITLGAGHTTSDAFLALPDDNIVFTGDLGFFGRQPYMAECVLDSWLDQLASLEDLRAAIYVPGHGLPGGTTEIRMLRDYFVAIEALVREALDAGSSPEDILTLRLPEPFTGWSREGTLLEANVQVFLARLGIQSAEGNG